MIENPVILVADDEAHIRNVLSLKLRNAGYEVFTASDGAEALAIALGQRVDLLISDYQMPIKSGMELCTELKAHDQTRSLPVLMLSARGFTIEKKDLDRTNIVAVLSKPFSPREILSRVQKMLTANPTDREPQEAV